MSIPEERQGSYRDAVLQTDGVRIGVPPASQSGDPERTSLQQRIDFFLMSRGRCSRLDRVGTSAPRDRSILPSNIGATTGSDCPEDPSDGGLRFRLIGTGHERTPSAWESTQGRGQAQASRQSALRERRGAWSGLSRSPSTRSRSQERCRWGRLRPLTGQDGGPPTRPPNDQRRPRTQRVRGCQ